MDRARSLWPEALKALPVHDDHKAGMKAHWRNRGQTSVYMGHSPISPVARVPGTTFRVCDGHVRPPQHLDCSAFLEGVTDTDIVDQRLQLNIEFGGEQVSINFSIVSLSIAD